MQAIKSKRWRILSAALVLIGLGFLAGALSMNLYLRRGRQDTQRKAFLAALSQLNLNSDQQAKVDAILADTRNQLKEVRNEESPKVRDIRRKARERLQSVLTPEQWRQLQETMKARGPQAAERSSLPPAPDLEQ